MKRFFALALVLVMALSMMAMFAAAAPAGSVTYTCPDNRTFVCSDPEHVVHYFVLGPGSGDQYAVYYFEGNDYKGYYSAPLKLTGLIDGDVVGEDGNYNQELCLNYVPAPQPKPQPKTGVMDTLPLWFGVMAVSACAYVLTSKKKVF